MAHCSIFDMDNNALILDEAVENGRSYKLSRYGEYYHLECPCLTQGNSHKGTFIQSPSLSEIYITIFAYS